MSIYIAADHRGFALKQVITAQYPNFIDLGPGSLEPEDDYVDYATTVCETMKPDDRAILICGSGHGMDIAANRFKHIRAILGYNQDVVRQGRQHEDANVLVLAADWVSADDANNYISTFLSTEYTHESRNIRRLDKVSKL